jgi:sphinganine-1-phosphate aldolase
VSADPMSPMPPMPADEVLATLRALQAADLPVHGGRTLAYVYDSGLADADALGLEALAQFASSNALDPTAFPSLLRMENDLVAMAGALLDAPDGFAGSVTSGGTESILLAVLAAREGARQGLSAGEPAPGTQLAAGGTVRRGNIVLPVTAHAAFLKAAKYFGLEPRVVDVDHGTLRADPAAIAAAVDDDTVLLVASAPSYAHGVVDPVTEIAALAAERGIRCHVDACIGGWVLPHLDDTPPWTFAVPGVTSISVDLHKYAYTPKGVSVLLHRTPELRRGHFFASADWPGYTMLNSTMQSTKSGGPLAAAWAVTHHIGTERYARLARAAHDATLEIAEAARGMEGLEVFAEPASTLLALVTDGSCDVFTIADEMLVRGWFVQPQMTYRDLPPTLHLTLSAATAPSAGAFVDDLRQAVAAARDAGPVAVDPALGQLLGALDPAALDDAAFAQLLAAAGLAGEGGGIELPQRMAPVNALLDACPAPLREALLLGVLDRLSRPTPG